MLIGTSTQAGAFTEAIVRDMAAHTDRPIIMPLSNPTSKAEALPADLLAWTDGRALVATGSPFAPVELDGVTYRIAQANNALVFPGLGLGVTVARAHRITDRMIAAAADAVARLSDAGSAGRTAAAAGDRPAAGLRSRRHRRRRGRRGRRPGPGAGRRPDPAGARGHVAPGLPAGGDEAALTAARPPRPSGRRGGRAALHRR